MQEFVYEGPQAREISFPLGGIGSGCIGLSGHGQLLDCEIFGRPNKGSHMGFTHFAVRAEDENGVLDARALLSDLQPPYTGRLKRPPYNGFGFGPDRESCAGLPHFRSSRFTATFPFARIDFEDEHFPGAVTLSAWSPFIPLQEDDSSLPAAFFEIELHNPQDRTLTYTVAFTAANVHAKTDGIHTLHQQSGLSMLALRNKDFAPDDPQFGDVSLGTDAKQVSVTRYWYRGNWFDNLSTYWREFNQPGPLRDRNYDGENRFRSMNGRDAATLAAHIRLEPNQRGRVRFVLSWSTPNMVNYWNPDPSWQEERPNVWKHYYATLFPDSLSSLRYCLEHYDRLHDASFRFAQTLHESTLPKEALSAVSANLAVLKSPTCLRLTDGSMYGFEGCHHDAGCCEGSCTHVWSYTYALAFLFPRLERSMRTLEYTYGMKPDGGMGFRLMLPIGRAPSPFRACVDGQYGCVMRTWREYQISGDLAWLRSLWPQIKRSIEFAWSPENEDMWDLDKDGIMEGRQHHTLDMELFGPNAWLSGMYLGGLSAGARIARAVGDEEAAREYESLFERGRAWLNTELWNGRYFIQKVDIEDRAQLDRYAAAGASLQDQDVYSAYWNDEVGQLIYQIQDGCGIDQLLSQWHANLIGLPQIFDGDKVRTALASIYAHNHIPNMRDHYNPCRLYALNDEGGTVICTWPEGAQKPAVPIPYAEEAMHGFEYQAGIHMIQEGMAQQGLAVIGAVRARYDGEKRNPWNEIECGSNYARSMASYALLLSYSGFEYDVPNGRIGFSPIVQGEFRALWSLDGGWGSVHFDAPNVAVTLCAGQLTLSQLRLGGVGAARDVLVDGASQPFRQDGDTIHFEAPVTAHKSIEVQYA